MTAAVVEARGIGRVLPGPVPVTLVEGIDLSIGEGEFVAITGPSGSGKSSLLYLLGLLDRPTSGSIILEGRDTAEADAAELAALRLSKLGFVFQFHFLLPEFTVLGNVMIPMRKLGGSPEAELRTRAQALLEDLGLGDQAVKLFADVVEQRRLFERLDLVPAHVRDAGIGGKPFHAFGEEVGELHRDAPSERVPDEGDPVDVEVVEQVAHRRGVGTEGVVPRGLLRVPVAEEVGDEDPLGVVHHVDEVPPLLLRAEDPVDEEHHRAGPAVDVGELVAVESDLVGSQLHHASVLEWSR